MNWKRFAKAAWGPVAVLLASLAVTYPDNVYVQAVLAVSAALASALGIYETPYVPKEERDVF